MVEYILNFPIQYLFNIIKLKTTQIEIKVNKLAFLIYSSNRIKKISKSRDRFVKGWHDIMKRGSSWYVTTLTKALRWYRYNAFSLLRNHVFKGLGDFKIFTVSHHVAFNGRAGVTTPCVLQLMEPFRLMENFILVCLNFIIYAVSE